MPATIDHAVAHINREKGTARTHFDGVGCVSEGLDVVSKRPNLTRRLLDKGYTPARIRKVHGGNLLRVMTPVEQHAAPQPR